MNKSVNADHAFDLDAEPEPIQEDDVSDYDGGYDAMADGNDHGEFRCSLRCTISIYKFKNAFVRSWSARRSSFVRGGRPSVSFSSLWAAFTLNVHINALYNESVYGREEHAT